VNKVIHHIVLVEYFNFPITITHNVLVLQLYRLNVK